MKKIIALACTLFALFYTPHRLHARRSSSFGSFAGGLFTGAVVGSAINKSRSGDCEEYINHLEQTIDELERKITRLRKRLRRSN